MIDDDKLKASTLDYLFIYLVIHIVISYHIDSIKIYSACNIDLLFLFSCKFSYIFFDTDF